MATVHGAHHSVLIPRAPGSDAPPLEVHPIFVEQYHQVLQALADKDIAPQFVAGAIISPGDKTDEVVIEHAMRLAVADRYIHEHPKTRLLGIDRLGVVAGIAFARSGLTVRHNWVHADHGLALTVPTTSDVEVRHTRNGGLQSRGRFREFGRLGLLMPALILTPECAEISPLILAHIREHGALVVGKETLESVRDALSTDSEIGSALQLADPYLI